MLILICWFCPSLQKENSKSYRICRQWKGQWALSFICAVILIDLLILYYYIWVMCQMMSLDSDSKENSRNLEHWKSWRSCYFWPFDRNEGRLIAKEYLSVKIGYTCSLFIWWDVMGRVRAGHDSMEFEKFPLCSTG